MKHSHTFSVEALQDAMYLWHESGRDPEMPMTERQEYDEAICRG